MLIIVLVYMATIFPGVESMGWAILWKGEPGLGPSWRASWLQPQGPPKWVVELRLRVSSLALILGLALWLGSPVVAWAEVGVSLPGDPNLTGDAEVTVGTIPSEKVTQFVTAYLQVVALIDARSEELEAAPTEAESLALQQAIQAAAYEVIEATGLTRQEYWQLLGLANSDMEFRDRVLAQLEEFP